MSDSAKKSEYNIMIVGVGGQGSLLASKLLGRLLDDEGFDVKISEVHGMSQRGGSVVTYVKASQNRVYSPIITDGEADFIVSFEKIEAARYAKCLKKGGTIVVNNQETDPMPVITGAADYPHGVLEELKSDGTNVDEMDALVKALEAGNAKCVNMVLMGRLSGYLDVEEEKWLKAIEKIVKPQLVDMNKKAFMLGRS